MRAEGPIATTHMLKPPIGILQNEIDMTDGVANEYVCLELCQAFGLDVAGAEIESFEDQTVLSVRRVDRLWDRDRLLRLPQEEFVAAHVRRLEALRRAGQQVLTQSSGHVTSDWLFLCYGSRDVQARLAESRVKLTYLFAAVGLSLFGLCACTQKYESQLTARHDVLEGDRVAAVLIFAEWCPSCKVLDPKVESVRASEDWTGVSFVLLDFTDKNEGALLKAADEAGIGPAIRRATLDGIRTGQLILMDIAAQEEMSRIGKGTSVKDMAERIRLARDEVS